MLTLSIILTVVVITGEAIPLTDKERAKGMKEVSKENPALNKLKNQKIFKQNMKILLQNKVKLLKFVIKD